MPAQHIAFRTDATLQTGTGHFMRCITLADGLLRRGAKIRFVSRGLPAHLRDMLGQRSIELASLDSDTENATAGDLQHSQWLGCSQEQDAQATQHKLSDRNWDWLIVDHYALDARWESKLRGSAGRIMVIDDIADRQHDCDLLLDQNFYADMQTRYTGKVPPGCEMLLGPRYALLREEFRKLREHTRPRTGPVKKILVFFGGVDSDNYTGLAIEVLSELKKPDMQIDVVIGAQHPCRSAIEKNCALQGYLCHVQTTRMAELMLAADLAIGAGGSATWERCAMGVPSIIMVLADNQSKAAIDLDCAGVLISLGDARLIDKSALKQATSQLIENEQLREDLSLASLALVKISEQNELAEMLVANNV